MSNDDIKLVKITHPDGVDMRFSENISEFLMNRPGKSKPFFIGHWLETLDDHLLVQLGALNEQFAADNVEINLDDLVQTVILANIAETGVNSVTADQVAEWMPLFGVICSIESLSRGGLIDIDEPLSLRPKSQVRVRVTDLGVKQGIELRSLFN